MQLLFGYGSLISKESTEKTLGRSLDSNQILEAILPGYNRTWGAKIDIKLDETSQLIPASFLNLVSADNSSCNGVIFPVTDQELLKFDQREVGYDRVKVSVIVNNKNIEAITYITTPNNNQVDQVMQAYLDIINQGLKVRSSNFAAKFWQSTAALPKQIIAGSYTFGS